MHYSVDGAFESRACLIESHAVQHEGQIQGDDGQISCGCEEQQICTKDKQLSAKAYSIDTLLNNSQCCTLRDGLSERCEGLLLWHSSEASKEEIETLKGKGDLLDPSKGLCSPDTDRACHVVQSTQGRGCKNTI